ncbi:hypothetical protein Btru_033546 [Bulinus truncatus]|nr:hypothetical protein Btru_033546 [Bulinus truncatus]
MTKVVGFPTTLLLTILYSSSFTESTCSNGWFGDYCQYKCHCKNNPCNSDGSCKGAGCESGWFGYKCQYRNLITQDNSWLTDENDDTCNEDKSIDKVSLPLNRDNIFTWLKLIFNATEPFRYVTLQFTTLVSVVECPDQKIIQTDNRTLLVWCTLNVTVNRVNITGEGVKSLCSVYVSGGRNVALKQPTVQTSTYTDSSTDKKISQSMNAVDGNTNQNFYSNSCTHTAAGDSSPTWTVEFNETLMINKFVLYNRNGSEKARLKGFRLQAFNKDLTLLMNYTDNETQVQDIYYVNYFLNKSTDVVNITAFQFYSGVYLTLCEVEIFGACPAGMWGINCDNNCTGQCWSSNCDSKSGLCLSGCRGYRDPPYCTQVCAENRWGLNCSQNCSSHCQNNPCHRLNGDCQFGCVPGYFSPDCTQECRTGYWGSGCKEQCNTYCVKDNCSKETGLCLEGCMGYSDPPTCKTDCPVGRWGLNCANNCTGQCWSSNCDSKSGLCLSGCLGFMDPPYCTQVCAENKWGLNCSQNCSSHCQNNTCRRLNGDCQFGCVPGYFSPDCTQECRTGYWGSGCKEQCNTYCVKDNCSKETGLCLEGCMGYSDPPTCKTDCPVGRWGLNCANNCTGQCWSSNCDSKSGLCLSGCLGFMDPPYCTQVCAENKWGLNCSQNCSSHCQNNTCHRLNGDCQFGCVPGYFSPDCTQECRTGYWGSGCKEQCNTYCVKDNCSKETGLCLEGCMGYSDPPTCKTAVQENDDTQNVGAIVGSVIAVVLILGLAVLAFFLYRRHVGAKRKAERPIKMTLDHDISSSFKRSVDKDVTDISQINDSKLMVDETNQESDYYNSIQTDDEDRTISVSYLNMFMATHKKPFFMEQFNMIPSAGVSMENANNEQNKNKNRYKNICTYDHSRVNLNINTIKNEGDYINASYIKGFGDKVEFIASQGPNKVILNDFVRMLWEQNTEKIVMLTNLAEEGKTKCEQYWPDEGKIMFGDVKVKLLTTTPFSDFTIRRLELSKKNDETHHITHYQYHSWPDKGVPLAPWSLIDFVNKVTASTSPHLTVVHCSAGVGRTGTFIALLNVIKQALETGKLNFFETVTKLRQDRIFMVQTATQYEFLHKAAQTALLCINSTLTLDELKNKMNKIKQKKNALKIDWIESEWKHLCDVCSNVNTEDTSNANDEDDNVYQNTHKTSQQEKNRFPDIVPKPMDRPFLHVATEATDDYINAVFVQGIKQKNRYILSQLPMHQTVDDFWRLVTQYKINTIVAFEMGEISKDKTIAQYLPTEKTQVFKTSMFEITSNSCKQTFFWDDQRLTVTCNSDTKCERQEVTCITTLFKDLNVKKWLSLSKHLQASNTPQGKIVFLCRNGAQYSGLACVLNLVLETLDIHLKNNVPLAVGTVKSIRPEVVPTLDQYRLIYDVLESFHESSAQYTSVGDKLLKEML